MASEHERATPFDTIKLIWRSSWFSLWQGEKRMLPVVLIGYGAMLILMVASITFLGISNQIALPQDGAQGLPLPLIDIVIMALLLLILANFVMAALITRAYAWLHKDKALADRTWHNARNCFMKLFVIHLVVLCIDVGIQYAIIKLTAGLPESIKMLAILIGFFVYLLVLALPFVIFTAITIEGIPFSKAVPQGFKLLTVNWMVIVSVLTLGILLPAMALMSLIQIPGFNLFVALFLIFAYYPFTLILMAFANVILYQDAKKKYQQKLLSSGINITQA